MTGRKEKHPGAAVPKNAVGADVGGTLQPQAIGNKWAVYLGGTAEGLPFVPIFWGGRLFILSKFFQVAAGSIIQGGICL